MSRIYYIMLSSKANHFSHSNRARIKRNRATKQDFLSESSFLDTMSYWNAYAPIMISKSSRKVLHESSRGRSREVEGSECRIASTRIAIPARETPPEELLQFYAILRTKLPLESFSRIAPDSPQNRAL